VELWDLSQIHAAILHLLSCKQPVVANSVGEAEQIAQNRVGDYVEWAREMLIEFGYPQETVPMYVDSQCAMQMLQQGTGSFKRAKHIKVRFFWMKELLDNGLLKLIYMPTDELVADISTKPLAGWKFRYYYTSSLGGTTANCTIMEIQLIKLLRRCDKRER
jgi:hypothetical protein